MIETFTKVPNWFWDLLPNLKEADLRVLLVIIRQTNGFHREEAPLSYDLLEIMTGLSREGVNRGLKRLKEAEIIDQHVQKLQAQKLKLVNPQIVATKLAAESTKLAAESTKLAAETNEIGPASNLVGPYKETIKHNSKDNIKQNSDVVELLLDYGFNYDTAFYLEGILVAHGRDITHIRGVMGYVARAAKSNPHGLLIKMIEQNSDVPKKASQNGSQRLIEPAKGNMSAERLAELARITKGA